MKARIAWMLILCCWLLSAAANADRLVVSSNGPGEVSGVPGANTPCRQGGIPSSCEYLTAQVSSPGQTETITLARSPDSGAFFQGWGGACSGVGLTCTVVLPLHTDDVNIPIVNVTASFAQISRSINVTVQGNGSVFDGGSISCPNNCSSSVTDGTTVSLSASAIPGNVFVGWQGTACDGQSTLTCTFVANSDQDILAVFAPEQTVPTDTDGDGVFDDEDQCPETPPGSSVDEDGCALSQLDSDSDGVSDAVDRCPDTPVGDEVDNTGCTVMDDEDEDGDGVIDDEDRCPGTPAGLPVDDFGCSVEQNFGNDLGDLEGLSPNEQVLGSRIDEICPLLLAVDIVDELTPGQRDLLDACIGLKSRGTSSDQAADALGEISLTELAAMLDYVVELSNAQHSHLGARLRQVADGGGRGASVAGLNVRSGDQVVPGHVLQSAFEGLLGMAAGEGDFSDFGKLGLYLQGDINVGDKDETELENGYDFDAWNITLGGDYRFSNNFFGGLSLSLGEVEVDYEGLAGKTDIENWSVAAYGGWQISDAWYLDGLLSYGRADFEMTRRVIYSDVNGRFDSTQQSDTEGDQIYFGLNTGYMWTPLTETGSWRIGPIASLTYLDGSIDGFDETTRGSGSLAWNFIVDDRDYESLRLHLGFQADYIWNTSWGVLIPGIRAAWVMENEDGPEQIDLRLVNNPFNEELLQSENISIVTEGRDSSFFDASLNLSAQFQHGFSGFLSYQRYSGYNNFSRQGFTFGFRWDKPY